MDGGAGPCCHGTGSLRPPSERSQRTDVSPRATGSRSPEPSLHVERVAAHSRDCPAASDPCLDGLLPDGSGLPRMTDWGSTVGFHGLSTMPGRVSFPPMGRGAEGIELHCASMVEDLDLIEVGRRPAVWLASENHDLGLLRDGSVSIRASQD